MTTRTEQNQTLIVTSTLQDAIEAMEHNRIKAVVVLSGESKLLGLITDGDIRRALLRGARPSDPVSDVMNSQPTVIFEDEPANRKRKLLNGGPHRFLPIVSRDVNPLQSLSIAPLFVDSPACQAQPLAVVDRDRHT